MATSPTKFKQLNRENWREIDNLGFKIVRVDRRDGSAHDLNIETWVETLLEPQFANDIPEKVRELFEVARGAMLYGAYFYPLFTLGSEQMFRVLEAALSHKATSLGAPLELTGFKRLLDWLASRGVIPASQISRWEAARHLRNAFSHPQQQSLMLPTHASTNLRIAVELIDALFADSGASG